MYSSLHVGSIYVRNLNRGVKVTYIYFIGTEMYFPHISSIQHLNTKRVHIGLHRTLSILICLLDLISDPRSNSNSGGRNVQETTNVP